jgi:hypothetical protein
MGTLLLGGSLGLGGSLQTASAQEAAAPEATEPAAASSEAAETPAAEPTARPAGYKRIPGATTDPKTVKAHAKEAAEALRGSNFGQAEQDLVRRYFIKHVMAGMTLPASDPGQYPRWREQIAKALGGVGGSERHRFLRGEIFKAASALAEDPAYSPACRYNAILVLGDLNDTEVQRSGANFQAAVPYTPARALLLKLVNGDQPQAIQLAAMIGLQRHARLLAAAGQSDENVLTAARKVLGTKDAPANGTSDGLLWMQKIAVDIVASGGKGADAGLFEPILSDATKPVMIRCAAAEALGRLDYTGVTNLNAAALGQGLGQLAVAACQQEIQNLQKRADEVGVEGDRSAFRTEGGRSEEGDRRREGGEDEADKQAPENPVVKQTRRMLKYQLLSVSQGLGGLLKANVDAKSKTSLTSLKTQVDAVLKTLEPAPDLLPTTLLEKLSQPAVQLEKTVIAGIK